MGKVPGTKGVFLFTQGVLHFLSLLEGQFCLFINMQMTPRHQDLPALLSVTTWQHAWGSQFKVQGKEQAGPTYLFNQDHTCVWLLDHQQAALVSGSLCLPLKQSALTREVGAINTNAVLRETVCGGQSLEGAMGQARKQLFPRILSPHPSTQSTPPTHSLKPRKGHSFVPLFHSFCSEPQAEKITLSSALVLFLELISITVYKSLNCNYLFA